MAERFVRLIDGVMEKEADIIKRVLNSMRPELNAMSFKFEGEPDGGYNWKVDVFQPLSGDDLDEVEMLVDCIQKTIKECGG